MYCLHYLTTFYIFYTVQLYIIGFYLEFACSPHVCVVPPWMDVDHSIFILTLFLHFILMIATVIYVQNTIVQYYCKVELALRQNK